MCRRKAAMSVQILMLQRSMQISYRLLYENRGYTLFFLRMLLVKENITVDGYRDIIVVTE